MHTFSVIQLPSKKQTKINNYSPTQTYPQKFENGSHVEPPQPLTTSPSDQFMAHLDKRIKFY